MLLSLWISLRAKGIKRNILEWITVRAISPANLRFSVITRVFRVLRLPFSRDGVAFFENMRPLNGTILL